MPKALIIAEKPSVAADLARALAKAPGMKAFTKEKDWYENETHVISSAVGHLLELGMPMVDGKKVGWGFTSLPIMPEQFELNPIEQPNSSSAKTSTASSMPAMPGVRVS